MKLEPVHPGEILQHEFLEPLGLSQYGLAQNKLIVKQGKRYEVPVLLSFSNYALFFIKPCYSKISSSPTKHGEIMAMGIPVITNRGVGDVEEIVVEAGVLDAAVAV